MFLDALTAAALDLAAEMFAHVELEAAHAENHRRDADDWRLRFKDRDDYAGLLEAELLPLRRAEVEHEQGVLA